MNCPFVIGDRIRPTDEYLDKVFCMNETIRKMAGTITHRYSDGMVTVSWDSVSPSPMHPINLRLE